MTALKKTLAVMTDADGRSPTSSGLLMDLELVFRRVVWPQMLHTRQKSSNFCHACFVIRGGTRVRNLVLNSATFCPVVRRVSKIANSFVSVHMEQTARLPLDGFWSWYLSFFEKLLRKFKFNWNPSRLTGILHEGVFTFMIIWLNSS